MERLLGKVYLTCTKNSMESSVTKRKCARERLEWRKEYKFGF